MTVQRAKPNAELSDREIQVLTGVSHGYGNKQIAKALCIQPATVKSHLVRISTKLGALDRAHAVALGFRKGVLK